MSLRPRSVFMLLLPLLSVPPVLAQDRDPFAGTWSGKEIALALRADAAPGAYSGTLTFEGKAYPCAARAKGADRIAGTFRVDGEAFEFVATRAGDRLTLTSGGQEYTLRLRPAPQPAVPAAPAAGGVGIALALDGEDWVIAQVKPDGPAARSGIRAGCKLRAVDGKSVKGLTREQLQARIQGAAGTLVTLTVETDTEIQDVVLTRAALGANGPAPTPTPAEPNAPVPPTPAPGNLRPTPLPGGGAPLPADAAVPEWLKPGTRVTWFVGSAQIPGVSSTLEEDENGNWVDPATNRRYSEQRSAGSGGAGFLQMDFVHAGPDGVAAEAHNHMLMDATNGNTMSGFTTGYVGDLSALGDYWVNPARLAQLKVGRDGGVQILRGPYPLEGRVYQSVSIKTTTPSGYTRYTYDVVTGLCLVYSASTVGRATQTIDPTSGQVSPGAGAHTIVHTRLLGVRDLRLPWAAQPMPAWLKQGGRLEYSGTYGTVIPGAEVPPQRLDLAVSIDRLTPGFGVAKLYSRLAPLYGNQPTESTSDRVVGGALMAPLYIAPAILRRLPADTVLDEDPITRVRTVFAGVQNNVATVVQRGPLESSQFGYDLDSGAMVVSGSQTQQGPATVQIQLRLAGRR